MPTFYAIKMIIGGEERRLAQESDLNKRLIFDTKERAEQEAAFWRSIHPEAEIIVQTVTLDNTLENGQG